MRRTIYTLHPTEYETITRAIDEVTGGAEHPAQTIVGVTGLAVPGCLIEIEVHGGSRLTARTAQQLQDGSAREFLGACRRSRYAPLT